MTKFYTPSMLKVFDNCPKKFEYKFEKNINMPTNDEIFEFGKKIHALAAYYLRNENIISMEKSLSQKEAETWEYIKNLPYLTFKTIGVEYNLSVKIGDNFFGGRLDALLLENEYYYILDYKTGAIPIDIQYDYQTMIYMLCVQKFFKTDKIKFVYIDLKNKKNSVVDFNNDLGEKYLVKLNQISDKINNAEEFKKNKECKCEYSIICK